METITKKQIIEQIALYQRDRSGTVALHPERYADVAEALMIMFEKTGHKQMRGALEEISEGKGRYDTDRLKHAQNTIEDMMKIASDTILEIDAL